MWMHLTILLFLPINPSLPQWDSFFEFNKPFVDTTSLVVGKGTFREGGGKEGAYRFSKDLVTFAFKSNGWNDISYSSMNLNILPLAPVFSTYPSGVTVWSTLINKNGTAILETGIVGY